MTYDLSADTNYNHYFWFLLLFSISSVSFINAIALKVLEKPQKVMYTLL